MEIKAQLNKPYTDKERLDFIVEQNHVNGYEIRETETELQAWGKTNDEIFVELKKQKQIENQQKLDIARTSHSFTVTLQNQECEFDTKDKTQSDLNSAAISASIGQPWLWTTNNRITLSLTSEDILAVSSAYAQAVNADIAKWTEYEALIEQAQTTEDVQEIEIVY